MPIDGSIKRGSMSEKEFDFTKKKRVVVKCLNERPKDISTKQACAAVGQARLMMTYQRMFAEYNQIAGQILMTKNTMVNPVSRENAQNTFEELFRLGVIPIVNENDTVSTYEMQFK